MAGLYKKVVKGIYPKIPNHFSKELDNTIKALIIENPTIRPSCKQILAYPDVRRIGERIFGSSWLE
jgi:NIMA (never in mitosis gene a)-related kinase